MKSETAIADAMLDIWKEVGGENSLQVSGSSMRPLIAPGETVRVKLTDAEIVPGEIVAFKRGRRIVVHRVLRVCAVRGETVFLCRGDNNLFLDARVTRSKILGRVVAIEKTNGTSVHLRKRLWQIVGRLIVLFFDLSRKLPRRLPRKRVAKIFTRIALFAETLK